MEEDLKKSDKTNNELNENNQDNIINNSINDLEAHSKRSYSCKIIDQKKKKFSGAEEIKMNITKKLNCLKTPQIKPKKGKLNPIPINIGVMKKNSRFKPIKGDDNVDTNIFNDTISEGENETSNKESSDSSSDPSDDENLKDDNNINNNINEENEELNNEYCLMKIRSENKIFSLADKKIKEENEDDFNEEGNIILKNLRKTMFRTKKSFLKNDKDYFNVINYALNEKIGKYKEDILMPKLKKKEKFHNTISFTKSKAKNNEISILEFLRKKSSIDKAKFDN